MFFLGLITVAATDDGNNQTATRGSLDLGTKTTHDDTIVEAALGGNGWKVAFVGDAAGAVTITTDQAAKVLTVHFHDAVSTVGNVETAITALTGLDKRIRVKTPGTGATVLHKPADEFAATVLAGGTGFVIPVGVKALYLEADTDGVQFEIKPADETFGTTAGAGGLLFNAKGANVRQGPYPVGDWGPPIVKNAAGAPVPRFDLSQGQLAIHNPLGGGVNVRVWGAATAAVNP